MNLRLNRSVFTKESTIGELFVGDKFECYVLEDRVRNGTKVAGKTAIPEGNYEIALTFSQRFQRPLPLLLLVPGFSGVRIHPGNTAADTEGCLLVGTVKGDNQIFHSREAFEFLWNKLTNANKSEKIWIEIRNVGVPVMEPVA